MVRPKEDIFFKDTYVFKLQKLLNSKFYVVPFVNRANTVIHESNQIINHDGMIYSEPDLIILHLGIVDCAPRLFGPTEHKILELISYFKIFRKIISSIIKIKSKYRKFFTKYFQKTYVSEEMYKEKLEFIIKQIKNNTNSMIFIINIADTHKTNKERSYNFNENIIRYNKILSEMAETNSCTLIDFHKLTKENKSLILQDGIHLSKQGHEILSCMLYENIKRKIKYF
ncbi:MAG: SGNH/GDSL hydrolase family protein [Methanobacterium sp. ERen5]|nr:MAG: SGNH/GDSL hydrolase family protein [Methanobacterium sp. ERen5]